MVKVSTLSIVGILIISLIAVCGSLCPTKFRGFEGHTACISRSPNYISGGVNYQDERHILNMHNKFRSEVQPPACTMFKMYWDDELAYLAQKWSENCKFEHDKPIHRNVPGSYSVGQNLGRGTNNWTAFVDAWHSELKNFVYDGKTNKIEVVGHYTQMVWGTSTLIGCGYSKCKNVNLFVCDYAPGGNDGQIDRPYEKCETVSHLRDCDGKVCKNGGSFHRNRCECICKDTPQIGGPMCDMNCTISDRPMPCGSAFKYDQCNIPNIPYECPWMCKVCPYANGSVSFKNWATYLLVLAVLFLVLMM